MTPVIRIDDQVMDELNKRAIYLGNAFVTPNDILRIVLDLDVKTPINLQENRVIEKSHKGRGRLQNGLRTPKQTYRRPILEALNELGGRAYANDVLKIVEEKVKPRLNEFDLQKLRSGMDIRWRNAANWVRWTLVKEGLLKPDSRRGIWELSDKGAEEINRDVYEGR